MSGACPPELAWTPPDGGRTPGGQAIAQAQDLETKVLPGVLAGLRLAVIAVFVSAILCAILLPVYTDEIGWRFQERAGFDGVDKMFSELCGPGTLTVPSFFMWPVRWYSALFNSAFASPLWIRLSGILYALVWIGLVLSLFRRLVPDRAGRLVPAAVVFGLLGLGLSPLLAVWSRPEQPIVLAATFALWIAAADAPHYGATAAGPAWRRSLLLVMLAAIATSYHVKGLFVTPLILVCLLFASRGRASHGPRAVAAAMIGAVIAMAAGYWKHRLSCPGNADLAARYARNSISGALSEVSGPADAWRALAAMAENLSFFGYVDKVTPRALALSNWLAPGQIGADASDAWSWFNFGVWVLALAAAAIVLLFAVSSNVRERRFDPRVALAPMLAVTVLGWSATQLIRNVYEAAFVLPLGALAIALVLSMATARWLRHVLAGLALIVGLAGIGSTVALAVVFGPSLLRSARESGIVSGQQTSISPFGYGGERRRIIAAARLCGIDPRRSRAVMIDDATYFPFMRSTLPQHQLGVVGLWNGGTDPVTYLKSRRSSGAVVTCSNLPPDLRSRARANGRYCCLGPEF